MPQVELTDERLAKVRKVVDNIRYEYKPGFVRSAFQTLEAQKGCCLEGALVAALFLELLGHPPRILHIATDRKVIINSQEVIVGHSVALYKVKGRFGTIGKSRYPELTHRSPEFSTVVDLLLSYIPEFQKHGYETTAWAIFELNQSELDWRNSRNNIHIINREITAKSDIYSL